MSSFSNDFKWKGRIDQEDGEAGRRWHQVVSHELTEPGIGLIGFACDLGVKANKGREGAIEGPDAIRNALANQAWHINGALHDGGTIFADASLDHAQCAYAQKLTEQLNQHHFVVGVGGGHEIAWGSYKGLANSQGCKDVGKRIGIINFDAHFDLRKPAPNPSSGTPFYQVAQYCEQQGQEFYYACLGVADTANTPALFSFANANKVTYVKDMDCEVNSDKATLSTFLANVDELYVTICLDVFPAHLAPGVSAPSALGVSPHYVISMLHWLGQQQSVLDYRWRLVDVAEMSPEYDIDNRTAKLAARLIHEACVAATTLIKTK